MGEEGTQRLRAGSSRRVHTDVVGRPICAGSCRASARAIYCAKEIHRRVRDLGIEVRAGVHTGECELVDGKRASIAVLHSRTRCVKDLVAGSGLGSSDAGEHELKGVPGHWRVYAAE